MASGGIFYNGSFTVTTGTILDDYVEVNSQGKSSTATFQADAYSPGSLTLFGTGAWTAKIDGGLGDGLSVSTNGVTANNKVTVGTEGAIWSNKVGVFLRH